MNEKMSDEVDRICGAVEKVRVCSERRRDRGRPYTRCNARSIQPSDAKVTCMDRKCWREFVSPRNGGVDA